jgi:hypothetical protein
LHKHERETSEGRETVEPRGAQCSIGAPPPDGRRGATVPRPWAAPPCPPRTNIVKAAKFTESATAANAPDEVREFQKLARSFATLADNEQWLANNHDKVFSLRI